MDVLDGSDVNLLRATKQKAKIQGLSVATVSCLNHSTFYNPYNVRKTKYVDLKQGK